MNIRDIRVKNFRSLRDAKLSCDHLTAIVGRNGTGKSSFLRALELFYDQTATATPDDFYNGDIDQDISITVTFSDLTPGALRLFSPYAHKGTLSITRVFSGEQGTNNGKYHGSRLRNEEFTPVRNAGGKLAIRTAYSELKVGQPDNRHLLRLVDAEEQDWPAGVWDTHAALDGNLEQVLKREISKDVFEALFSARLFGMRRDRAQKNPFILRSIIEDANANGLRSHTLSEIVNAIIQIHPMHGDQS